MSCGSSNCLRLYPYQGDSFRFFNGFCTPDSNRPSSAGARDIGSSTSMLEVDSIIVKLVDSLARDR